MGDVLGDYLKFKGITVVGILIYPILAPLILGYAGLILIVGWITKR